MDLLEALASVVVAGLELASIGIIVAGAVLAAARAGRLFASHRDGAAAYVRLRRTFGRAILVALETLVAADIVRTVVIGFTAQGVVLLAGIVLVRTFLSFAMEVELYGTWPWQRGPDEGPPHTRREEPGRDDDRPQGGASGR